MLTWARGPPNTMAELILPLPPVDRGTHRSRAMPMTPPPPLPSTPMTWSTSARVRSRGWPLRASDPMASTQRGPPPRLGVGDPQGRPPAADDLPRRSDGQGHVVAGGDDGDGRAHPRPHLRRGVDRTRRGLARRERLRRGGGGRMREVASGIQGGDERGERRRRPADVDTRGRGAGSRRASLGRGGGRPTTRRDCSGRRSSTRRAPGLRPSPPTRRAPRRTVSTRRTTDDGRAHGRVHGVGGAVL